MNDNQLDIKQLESQSNLNVDNAVENKHLIKRKYQKPTIKSEALNSYGAICNGTTNGGRKASAMAPTFCNANRLNS